MNSPNTTAHLKTTTDLLHANSAIKQHTCGIGSNQNILSRPSFPILKFLLNVLIAIFLCACSSLNTQQQAVQFSDEELLLQAKQDLQAQRYETAANKLETLELEHPGSELIPEAMANKAYAYFAYGSYQESVDAADEFLLYHPTHFNAPYAQYLKGLSYFYQILDSGRDQTTTQLGIDAFSTLMQRFPQSKYAKDAKYKAEYLLNNLVGQKMYIARYYHSHGILGSALARYAKVLEEYPSTIYTAEALYRIVEIFTMMNQHAEARKYAIILGHNFPRDIWYKKAHGIVSSYSGF